MCGINKLIEEFLFLFILVFKINFSYNNFKEDVLLVEIFYICLNWQGVYFMKRKHFVSILFTLVFVFCIGIYSAFATEISVDSLSGEGSQGVELSVSKDGDIQASLDLEQLEEGIPFEKTITVWIDTDGNFYSNAPSTRAMND